MIYAYVCDCPSSKEKAYRMLKSAGYEKPTSIRLIVGSSACETHADKMYRLTNNKIFREIYNKILQGGSYKFFVGVGTGVVEYVDMRDNDLWNQNLLAHLVAKYS